MQTDEVVGEGEGVTLIGIVPLFFLYVHLIIPEDSIVTLQLYYSHVRGAHTCHISALP